MNKSPLFKVECYTENSDTPYETSFFSIGKVIRVSEGFYCKNVDEFEHTFRAVLEFPTTKKLAEVFYINNQKSYVKLYLDSKGNITYRYVFTNIVKKDQ